jgi:hypothetical protein
VSRPAAADVYDQLLLFLKMSVRTVFWLSIIVRDRCVARRRRAPRGADSHRRESALDRTRRPR